MAPKSPLCPVLPTCEVTTHSRKVLLRTSPPYFSGFPRCFSGRHVVLDNRDRPFSSHKPISRGSMEADGRYQGTKDICLAGVSLGRTVSDFG